MSTSQTMPASPPALAPPIDPWHAVWSAGVLLAMVVVIVWGNTLALNYIHVLAAILWTGIDLFMGFVVGPILRAIPFEARRSVMLRLTPRTMFIMPVLSIVTGTTGWFLAGRLGYLDLPWPSFGWVAAALTMITIMTIQGLGYLLPTQIRVYLELRKETPDTAKLARLTRAYFWVVASQGVLQVAMVYVMAVFRMGL